MVVKILLIIAISLLVIAAIGGLTLVKETKFSVVWIMVAIALLSLAALGVLRYILGVRLSSELDSPGLALASTWLILVVSVCLCVGVYYARKLVFYIDRINFQKQLTNKRILSTVLRTEEKERIRFSKELHDGLGPLLSSAKMSLSVIDKSALSEGDREILQGTTQVIDEAVRSLREISNLLSPHVLNEFGLSRGISNFASKIATINKVGVDYKSNLGTRRYNTDIEVILYRVVCELVGNSIRHSGCTRIGITLNATDEEITLEYSDNGRGFRPETTYSGMGLSNITSRVGSLNGTFDLVSAPGQGMKAVVEVKIK
ncbi:MAG: sensor histidine kinase [Rikenellaceae bacterium]|nr:sensor histidine kinase [Rikenellaceae bacterium]